MSDIVIVGMGGRNWNGPYVEGLEHDPWGHQYVAVVSAWPARTEKEDASRRAVWVLSAGPDGIIETGPGHAKPAGDDIGVRLN